MDLTPFNLVEALDAVTSIIDLVSKFPRRSTKQKVYRILKDMHFGPKGVLRLLRSIQKGEKLESEEFRKILIGFNDQEFAMQANFDRLNDILESEDVEIPIRKKHALGWLADDKAGIRRALRDEINYYDPDKQPKPKKKVQKLIKTIERLNAQIEKLDAELR